MLALTLWRVVVPAILVGSARSMLQRSHRGRRTVKVMSMAGFNARRVS